jgi:hypothetical protein
MRNTIEADLGEQKYFGTNFRSISPIESPSLARLICEDLCPAQNREHQLDKH